MINKTTIFISINILLVHTINCMQDDSQLIPDNNKTGVLAAYWGGHVSATDAFYHLANIGANVVGTQVNSLVTTTTNYISNDAALSKLGFPPINDVNNAELTKYIAIKERYTQGISNNNYSNEIFKNDSAFIERRQNYIKRVLEFLPHHTDGVKIATFCLKYYQNVMNYFEVARFFAFIKSKKDLSQEEANVLEIEFNSIAVSSDSQILRSVMQLLNLSENEQQKI